MRVILTTSSIHLCVASITLYISIYWLAHLSLTLARIFKMETAVNRMSKIFKSERLVYRSIEDSDTDFLYTAIQSDPVTVGLATPPLLTPATRRRGAEDTHALIRGSLLAVLICLPVSSAGEGQHSAQSLSTPIGYLSLTQSKLPHWRDTQVVIQINSSYQNQGYGGEAINWALDWAFRYADMHRVSIATVEFNARALALYKRLGFVEEGRKREICYFDFKWWDIIQLSLLDHEWKVLRDMRT